MELKHLEEIYDGCLKWRTERQLTFENQAYGYIRNMVEELDEFLIAIKNKDILEIVDALADMTVFTFNSLIGSKETIDKYLESILNTYKQRVVHFEALYNEVEVVRNMNVTEENGRKKIRFESKTIEKDLIECIEEFVQTNIFKFLDLIVDSKILKKNSREEFTTFLLTNHTGVPVWFACMAALGYDPYLVMKEVLKEISSRTGKYDSVLGKFVKDKGFYNIDDFEKYAKEELNSNDINCYLDESDNKFKVKSNDLSAVVWYKADFNNAKL